MRNFVTYLKNARWIAIAMAAVVVSLASAPRASADAIGTLSEANCSGGGVSITATSITWLPAGTLPGTGCIDTGIGTNITYSGGTLGVGDPGNIANIVAGGGAIDNFMTFQGTTLDFVLTSLGPGAANTNCNGLTIGMSCAAFAGSPFVLTDLGTSTLIGLSAAGTVTDDGVTSDWSGAFTTQVNESAAAIQTAWLNGGAVTSTQSAQFTLTTDGNGGSDGGGNGGGVPAPEPGTTSLLLLGVGFVLATVKIKGQRPAQAA